MKINVNGIEVDLVVNGDSPEFLAKKAKLADKGMSPDEVVRKHKEMLEKSKNEALNGN